MRTIIDTNHLSWFNPFIEFSVFEPIIKHESLVTEEMTKTPYTYRFKYAVPEYKKKDINISVQNNTLSIEGIAKKGKSWWNPKESYKAESHFLRRTQLSNDMDSDSIKAKMKNGVLNIEIPRKKEFVSYREIPVLGQSDLNIKNTPKRRNGNIINDLKQKVAGFFKHSA